MPGSRPSSDAARDRGGTEAVADVVERGIERAPRALVERQDELRDAVVQVADRHADERDAALVDERMRGVQEGEHRLEDRFGAGRGAGQACATG